MFFLESTTSIVAFSFRRKMPAILLLNCYRAKSLPKGETLKKDHHVINATSSALTRNRRLEDSKRFPFATPTESLQTDLSSLILAYRTTKSLIGAGGYVHHAAETGMV